jgi:transcriptional regulator with XRE-family HTH domain
MTVSYPRMRPHMRIDGDKLRQLREERFLSRAELGSRSGLHPDHIGRLERGDWQGGSRIDNIRKLAEALGVEPADLLED